MTSDDGSTNKGKMMKKEKIFLLLIAFILCFIGCKTVDLEQVTDDLAQSELSSLEEEAVAVENEEHEYLIAEELKTQDVQSTVIYVEQPVYVPESTSNPELEKSYLTGKDATNDSLKKAIQTPENYKYGTFIYDYDENFVYEVYAEPFHLTDIVLEAGEVITATPLLSEDDSVWELTAGVGKDEKTGLDVQHLFIKPAYSKLDSTLIIITNKRVYNFRIKSFADTHMARVKFTYPKSNLYWNNFIATNSTEGRSVETDYIKVSNPELLSFDYKMQYSIFKKPEFLPTVVYDDGQFTYIQVDDTVLQKELPILFNEKNEIVNYSVQKNVFIIPRLINKVTLRLEKEKVTIEKKKDK